MIGIRYRVEITVDLSPVKWILSIEWVDLVVALIPIEEYENVFYKILEGMQTERAKVQFILFFFTRLGAH